MRQGSEVEESRRVCGTLQPEGAPGGRTGDEAGGGTGRDGRGRGAWTPTGRS